MGRLKYVMGEGQTSRVNLPINTARVISNKECTSAIPKIFEPTITRKQGEDKGQGKMI